MIEPIISAVLVAIFGLIIGGLLGLAMLFGGYSREMSRLHTHRRAEGEERNWALHDFIKDAEERAEEGRRIARSMPRSARLFTAAFYGLIIILAIVIISTPLEMSLLGFIVSVISLLIGYYAVQRLFSIAKEGRIRTKGRSRFDLLPDEDREK